MDNKKLINYSLFQSRRKFNPITLFNQKKDLTYQEFVEFLQSKMVDSPGEDYYNKVKEAFLKLNEEKDIVDDKKLVTEKEPVIKNQQVSNSTNQKSKTKTKKIKKTKNEKELVDEKNSNE